ncbi:syntaxin-16 isoform X4 [Lingula anatina]|uniref:Syntaxin-16 isoform X3 n=1 Tax=Lingula anatina TaxID=7574 RepID=A0A1S3H775_LINAN|nr:syntaxin-16 isoform X3 [Lingula anatina]XP_013381833.1 syntaxin-16 isoform X4 [Lingula anatina]|eukprot:XP_013381832.1 syntaxin-16 isoform X3 [Lingula anatina]
MATRSLTEVYILMRNNALQNRHIFSEQVADDRMALVSGLSTDPEAGIGVTKLSRLPPEWVDTVEEFQFDITRIKEKMKELVSLHNKHLNRPTLDDSIDEEHAIEIQTQEITKLFHRCQRLVQQINSKGHYGSAQEQKLAQNIVSSLVRTLQDLTVNFRKSQSSYLKKLQSREERSKHYFETVNLLGPDFSGVGPENEEDLLYDRGFTDVQLQSVEDNTVVVQQREREIAQIVRSIQDLNEIFKDIATLVTDQGTILDRIDYNIEKTSVQVDEGLKQLQKAEKYQKKNRKMLVIVVLAVIVILLLIILIAVKSHH